MTNEQGVTSNSREFHLKDAVYFRLENDGSVSIVKRPKRVAYYTVERGFHDPETLLVSVDADSWDSIVAFTRGRER
jgi:hypothetical protein